VCRGIDSPLRPLFPLLIGGCEDGARTVAGLEHGRAGGGPRRQDRGVREVV
jgi:hypothetical protein